jgi:bifunctional UDP-N-acetylglucosamine pyrophosphorylase/glucosamine-1-phosphate N-acetyltransferase
VVVVLGDAPAAHHRTLRALVASHAAAGAATTVLTAVLDDPTGYGRVLRDAAARSRRSSSTRTPTRRRAVREINSGSSPSTRRTCARRSAG